MKLINIEGLFLQVNQYTDIKKVPVSNKRMSRAIRPRSSDPKRISKVSCLSDSHVFGDALDQEGRAAPKEDFEVYEDKMKQSFGPCVDPPSFKAPEKDTLEQIPQLREMFRMRLEPTLQNKIAVQTGPDLQLIAFNSRGQ